MTAAPRCPFCNAQGVNHIASKVMGSFALIFCGQCGAVYGVVPKPQQPEKTPPTQVVVRPVKEPAPKVSRTLETPVMPPQHVALTAGDVARAISDYVGKKIPLSPTQVEHVYRNASNDERSPLCPEHQTRMVKLTVPADVPKAGDTFWVCSHYSQCRYMKPPPAKKQKQPGSDDARSLGNLSVSPALKLAGETNLSEVIPYSQVATRMKLSAMNHGTLYNQVAEPDGPPICPTHKFDLVKVVIPQPYKNAGYKVWLCPHGGCDQWRLAETPK